MRLVCKCDIRLLLFRIDLPYPVAVPARRHVDRLLQRAGQQALVGRLAAADERGVEARDHRDGTHSGGYVATTPTLFYSGALTEEAFLICHAVLHTIAGPTHYGVMHLAWHDPSH